MKNTALTDVHIALGAKMVPFAGYNMPVQYEGVIAEHETVRNSVGVFDVSHMGEFVLKGPNALALIQKFSSNDASVLFDGTEIKATLFSTDVKSPGLEIGNPASITSTPKISSRSAIINFCSVFSLQPGTCSPSLNVVSKIWTRFLLISNFFLSLLNIKNMGIRFLKY